MTDRELLELAAKAAGLPYIKPCPEYSGSLGLEIGSNPMRTQSWNPLTDDGDALRLAVKLKFWVASEDGSSFVADDPEEKGAVSVIEQHRGDPYAATRRAIVRAAAAIGEAMQ